MDKQQFYENAKRMSPEQLVDVYHPIMEKMISEINNLSRTISNMELQKEEQDKHFDKLLQRIKAVATE